MPVAILAGFFFVFSVSWSQAMDISTRTNGFWDSTNTWNSFTVPAAADNVTIAATNTVTMRDLVERPVSNLTVNGILTHSGNTSNEAYKINLTVNGDFTVNAGGTINVDNRGYAASQGPGRGTAGATAGNHGGIGSGSPGNNSAMPTYGSIAAPTNLGSGADTAGGGAIRLTVAGTSSILGTISANGSSAGYRPGAGGSVYITTAAISGTNVISANSVSMGT